MKQNFPIKFFIVFRIDVGAIKTNKIQQQKHNWGKIKV